MASLPPDPWKILGLEKSADKSEIRSAYKKLALKCHPDKCQDAALKPQKQEEFQKVQQAYELLNDDVKRSNYEDQVKLAELRRQAAMMAKSMPTPPSRTPPRQHFAFEVRTAHRFRPSSPPRTSTGPAKAQTYFHASSGSYESDIGRGTSAAYEEERRARRAASHEYTTKREDEKKAERRRKEREEERERERDRERERREKEAREARKAEKKRQDKERKRESDDKRRPKQAYVEPYEDEDVYTIRPEIRKKPSSSSTKKHEEKSTRRDREDSPAVAETGTKLKHDSNLEAAASYIERSRGKHPSLSRSQTFQGGSMGYFSPPVAVPTPPPADLVDDIRRSPPRSSTRRASDDLPVRTKEKPYASSHKKSSREAVDSLDTGAASPRERTSSAAVPPPLQKSHTMPPMPPVSPPRASRSATMPQELYSRPAPGPPSFSRTKTWAPGEEIERSKQPVHHVYHHHYVHYDDESDSDRRHHVRRSSRRRAPSPEGSQRYKVDNYKTTRLEPSPLAQKYYDDYDDTPPPPISTSGRKSRRHSNTESRPSPDSHSSSSAYPSFFPYKVKTTKHICPEDIQFSHVQYSSPVEAGVWGAA